MGGTNLPGNHKLLNSISYDNAAKGIDSNSCPDVKVYSSTSYNNRAITSRSTPATSPL